MIRFKTTIESSILGNPDYIACYTCLTPLVLNKECWFIRTHNYIPRKEGTFKPSHNNCYVVCCSEGCIELASIALLW